jgi:7-carboxy-7-deazaguanine synthase
LDASQTPSSDWHDEAEDHRLKSIRNSSGGRTIQSIRKRINRTIGWHTMNYAVKELFYTLQGEGVNAGMPAVFCRFAGCNLWSGLESDRNSAICTFCDTDFVGTNGQGGGKFRTPSDLAKAIRSTWPGDATSRNKPFVVCTGGEPLLQLDAELVAALHDEGLRIAIETNGTLLPPRGIDWICVSPKATAEMVLRKGHELKLVYPQADSPPERYAGLDFDHFLIQPMDGPDLDRNTKLALEYCLAHPQWRLSLQTHKLLGIP